MCVCVCVFFFLCFDSDHACPCSTTLYNSLTILVLVKVVSSLRSQSQLQWYITGDDMFRIENVILILCFGSDRACPSSTTLYNNLTIIVIIVKVVVTILFILIIPYVVWVNNGTTVVLVLRLGLSNP